MLALSLSCAVSMPAEAKSAAASWPPFDYRLDEASVRVELLPSHGLPRQTLTLPGSGRASFEHDGRNAAFILNVQDMLALVNELYRLRFFDLPDRLMPPRSAFLKDDGSVGTQATRMHDALTTSVCFILPQYRKCVVYEDDPPAELSGLVQRLLADARQRTQAAGPAK